MQEYEHEHLRKRDQRVSFHSNPGARHRAPGCPLIERVTGVAGIRRALEARLKLVPDAAITGVIERLSNSDVQAGAPRFGGRHTG